MATRPLCERYRPRRFGEIIGQPKTLAIIGHLQQRGGLGGRCFWITGASGTGKTSLARLLANKVADPWNVEELDTSDVTTKTIERIRRAMCFRGIGQKGGMAWILNESHALTARMVQKLLTVVEPQGGLPPHVLFAMTTHEGQLKFEEVSDSVPLLSRCVRLELPRRGLAERFAARVKQIAEPEGLDGKPLADYIRLMKSCRNNARAALMAVESGAMLD